MGIRGQHPDFIVLDDLILLEKHDPPVCGACEAGEHASCWEHAPPPGVPSLTCPCRVSTPAPAWWRYIVVPGASPTFVPVEAGELIGLRAFWADRPAGVDGWVIFDQSDHQSVAGWFADQRPALALVADMNGPSAADLAEAVAALQEAMDLL